MAAIAEKLVILNSIAVALLNRVHTLIDAPKPEFLSSSVDLERFAKLNSKKFPAAIADADAQKQEREFEAFKQRVPDVLNTFDHCFNTVELAVDFEITALATLNEAAIAYSTSSNNRDLAIIESAHTDITAYILSLATRYIQVYLLIERCDQQQLQQQLCLYARAFHITKRTEHPSQQAVFGFIAPFTADSGSSFFSSSNDGSGSIWKLLHSRIASVPAVAVMLQSLLPALTAVISRYQQPLQTIISKRIFNITEDSSMKSLYSSSNNNSSINTHATAILHLDKCRQWFLLLMLLLPQCFNRNSVSIDLLLSCLEGEALMTVHRDVTFDVVTAFIDLFAWWKGDDHKQKLLSMHSKSLIQHQMTHGVTTAATHAAMLQYLCFEAEPFVLLITHNPHVLITKVDCVIAVLHVIRNELMWYYKHFSHYNKCVNSSVNSSSKGIKLPAGTVVMHDSTQHISYLLYYYNKLHTYIDDHKAALTLYYTQYIHNIDVQLVQQQINIINNNNRSSSTLTADMQQLLSLIITTASNISSNFIDNNNSGVVNFEVMRLNYYRLSSLVLSEKSAAVRQQLQPLLLSLFALMQRSRYTDTIDLVLRVHVSLSGLYWYRADVYSSYKNLFSRSSSNSSNTSDTLITHLSYLRIFAQADHNTHSKYTAETAAVNSEAQRCAQQCVAFAVAAVERCVAELVQLQLLQFDSMSVLERMMPSDDGNISNAAEQQQLIAAGLDNSDHSSSNNTMQRIALLRQQLCCLIQAFARINYTMAVGGSSGVGNSSGSSGMALCCYQSLSTSLTRTLRSAFRRIWFNNSANTGTAVTTATTAAAGGGVSLQGITVSVQQWATVTSVYYYIDSLLSGAQMQLAISAVMLSECSPSANGHSKNSSSNSSSSSDELSNVPIIHDIAAAYVRLVVGVSDLYGMQRVVYSSSRRCFLYVGSSSGSREEIAAASALSAQQLPTTAIIHTLTSVTALQQLVALIGVVGLSVIDTQLLAAVERRVQAIQQLTQQSTMQQAATQLISSNNSHAAMQEALQRIGVEPLEQLAQQLGLLSSVLQLRVLLFQAMRSSTQARAPELYDSLQSTYNHNKTHSNSHSSTDGQYINAIAATVGIDLMDNDPLLGSVFAKCSSNSNSSSEANLPVLIALSLLSRKYMNASYLPQHDAFTHNMHTHMAALQLVTRLTTNSNNSHQHNRTAINKLYSACTSVVLFATARNEAIARDKGYSSNSSSSSYQPLYKVAVMMQWLKQLTLVAASTVCTASAAATEGATLDTWLPAQLMTSLLQQQQQQIDSSNNSSNIAAVN